MINKENKLVKANRRKERAKFKLKGYGNRPRLVFNKTNRYLIAQVVDDTQGKTIAYATTAEKDFSVSGYSRKNKEAASELGKLIATRAKNNGIDKVMLDRSGMIYHGKIASFAEAAREKGLEF
ncbi:MAG: 50S ribosomal protein L18 [Leptospiraceae bacterium]|nr:50S ribosomal protein L18 [Leptospiraceae bacterium]MCP5496655.1 50S ribosomal protein L18 [Leptospiraceae bacterium]